MRAFRAPKGAHHKRCTNVYYMNIIDVEHWLLCRPRRLKPQQPQATTNMKHKYIETKLKSLGATTRFLLAMPLALCCDAHKGELEFKLK